MEWQNVYTLIEEKMFPHYDLDVWHRSMYYYLLSQTRLKGLERATIPLSKISESLKCSDWQARKIIRSLREKGCVEIEQTRYGHEVRPLLPDEMTLPEKQEKEISVDIEGLDFFKGRVYIKSLLARERHKCFYCMCDVNEETSELDHVLSQLNGGKNGYKNIVVACHRCNKAKLGNSAEDHIRNLYRKNMLSEAEFEERLHSLEALRSGERIPQI